MKAHLIDTNLMVSRSRSSVKVKNEGHIFLRKMARGGGGGGGAFMSHKYIMFFPVTLKTLSVQESL